MITKMKKVTLFISEIEADADLTVLGQLGVMHIKPYKPPEDKSIDRVHARIVNMEKAISILERYSDIPRNEYDHVTNLIFSNKIRGEIALMREVLETEEKRLQQTELLNELNQYKHWYADWGHISKKDIKALAEKGVFLKLYLLQDTELEKLADRKDILVVGKLEKMNQVVLMADNSQGKLEYEEIAIPKYHFGALENSIKQANHEVESANELLQNLHNQIPLLQDALDERIRRYSVRNVLYSGIDVENKFRYWKGYIPEHLIDRFTQKAKEYNWGYLLEDPTQEELDETPTLIRSPKWAKSIKPVMNFMGLVPGYAEIDVSQIFMLFFTFFTGILVGDAGYGLVFLLITLFVHGKQKFKPRIEFTLIYILSVSIMFWGILTGTYFGVEQIAEIPVLSYLIVDKLASFGGDDIFLQKFMFIVGAIHLSIGHIQTGLRYINSVKAIAQLGWVAIVWGLYLIVNQMVLGEPAPGIMLWLFIGGAVLIALFSNPGTSFFKGVLSSLGGLPLSLISGFSDIISYIRLYAVGLATVLMALSFNQMAIGDGITTVFAGIGAVIVLILGHGLNMILAAMAVIVHGVRLNMLEYAGHAGVEFSGDEYNPFKIKNTKN